MQPQQPHSSMLGNINRPSTQYPAAYSPHGVTPGQIANHAAANSSVSTSSLRQPATIVIPEANARAATSNPTGATSRMAFGYPHPGSAALPPPRTQTQHRPSYPPLADSRHPTGLSAYPVQVSGAVTSAPRPAAPAGTNTPSQQPPNLPTSTQSVSSHVQPDTHRPSNAPIPAPPPEIASLLHPALDLQAIQRKTEGSLSQVGVSLGGIWRHIVDTTSLEAAKHISDTLRWKERCLQFEEMYKNCKQKLDNMNHDNIMLQTQVSRLHAELRARGQERPVGPSTQVTRHHGAFPSKGQDHMAHKRVRTVSSVHPTPASAVEELPTPFSHIKGTSAIPFRGESMIDLSRDREDVETAPLQPEKIGQNEPLSALGITEEPHPAAPPTTAVRLPTPPEQHVIAPSLRTPQLSSPELATRVTNSPKPTRVTPPEIHGISGLLSSKPSSVFRTVTPVKLRSNVNNSTLTMAPVLVIPPHAVVSPVQTTKAATSSSVDELEEDLEEGEVRSNSPMASPVNEKSVQHIQVPLQSHAAASAEPAKKAPSLSDAVPPLSLYFKPNQTIPPIPQRIPKKRPLVLGEEGPVKKARPTLPSTSTSLPQIQTSIGSRSTTTGSSRPGMAERSSTQGPEGIPKPEPKSPVLPPNTPASSRSKSTEVAASTVKPAYEDTAIAASEPPSDYEGSLKQGLSPLITRELRRQDEVIYCYPCICEYERNPSRPVTRFTGEQSIFPHVLYHFESQHTEWWKMVQSDASNPT